MARPHMSGPEHYREADRLICSPCPNEDDTAAAQVHATLALAAATALHAISAYNEDLPVVEQWHGITAPSLRETV